MRNTILTIDDNPDNNKLISYYLRKEFDVLQAGSGEEGLKMIFNNPVDVILLDIMMPGMNGFDVLESISSNKDMKRLPVIMVTAKTELEDVKLSLQKGALDYIKKPIDFSELHNKINIALKFKKQLDEINSFSAISHIQDALIDARRLQQSLLPDKKRFNEILPDSFLIDNPKDIVSGDFYWLNKQNNQIFISLFDSSGHGVPGSMLSIMGHLLLNEIVLHNKEKSPDKIFNFLAKEINMNLNRSTDTYSVQEGMDGVFCRIDEQTDTLEFSSANRPLLICRNSSNPLFVDNIQVEPFVTINSYSLYILKGNLLSIGKESCETSFANYTIKLIKNDAIYLFTDGITDQMRESDLKKISKRQFFDILLNNQKMTMKEQKVEIYNFLKGWKSNAIQTDDILVIGMKYKSL